MVLHVVRIAADFVALVALLAGAGRLASAGGIELGPEFRSSLALVACAGLFAWACRKTATRRSTCSRALDIVLAAVSVPAVGAILKLGIEPTRILALAIVGVAYVTLLSRPVHVALERVSRNRRGRLAGAATAGALGLAAGLYSSGFFDKGVALLPAGSKPNLVIVSIDATRADILGCYGSDRNTSPTLDRLAEAGVRFEAAIAHAPNTHSSIASLLTSKYPAQHGSLRESYALPGEHVTLAEHLRELGYRTAAFLDNPWLKRELAFDQGYDTFVEHAEEQPILDWLRKNHARPFFLHVHLLHPHAPYDAVEPWASEFDPDYPAEGRFKQGVPVDVIWDLKDNAKLELDPRELQRMEALCASEVRAMDGQIGSLVSTLADLGVEDDTLVIVVADHGEEFMDHGSLGHSHTLYDELIRVPLVLKFPGVVGPGRVVREQVEMVDLVPTALGLLGLPALPDARGLDRAAALREGSALQERPAISQVYRSRGRHMFSVRTGRWKLIAHIPPLFGDLHHAWEVEGPVATDFIWGNRYQLYDLEADPRETKDLSAERPDVLAELIRELERIR